jgi:SAM-dependent MidA family methyltransferase
MPDCLLPPSRPRPQELPVPDAEALTLSQTLQRLIENEIDLAGGRIPFDRFMELALYAPGLGYYVAGSRKFGESGDFVTAPEISPLFAQCLARQAQQVLEHLGGGDLLEFGAGSGILAADLLAELARLECLPARYLIMELSPELRQRQRETLQLRVPALLDRVEWLERLPAGFKGLVLANELLDAMPVSRFRIGADGEVEECFVSYDPAGFKEQYATAVNRALSETVGEISAACGGLAAGYVSEVNLRQGAWLRSLAGIVTAGAVLLIDYGYPRCEYYHPQRTTGTLMCHYRHRAHPDPFRWVGLQDITSHVDFTAVAQVALKMGLRLAGYTTQAHFLMASGLDELMATSDPNDPAAHMAMVQGVKRLTLPSELGERFKVLGLQQGIDLPLHGFSLRDLSAGL